MAVDADQTGCRLAELRIDEAHDENAATCDERLRPGMAKRLAGANG